MRLHRLSMTAFGPFAGTEVVDFDALAASGLFLLHGPTGAGKTSVLDAVCYALYGQVPGARAGARLRVRSDHAPDDRQPSVQLEVTLGARRLEVTRTPEWIRPKKRGAGVTTAPATTHVRELVDGSWRPLTTRNDEAAQLLLDLVGMGHEQFTKVVLLPQGDFAAFLRADAEQRRQLLGRLFSIDVFAGAETWVGDERRRLAAQVEQADQRTAGLLARATEAFAGMPDTDEGELHDVLLAVDDLKPAHRVSGLLERATALTRAAEVRLET
ncbi:MAG TPA: SMC family ATPase, partial [Actinomycetales bacterium]